MAGDLVVSAASSLTNAFKDIAQSYEAQHPGTKVLLNFGASGALLQQMAKGAPRCRAGGAGGAAGARAVHIGAITRALVAG